VRSVTSSKRNPMPINVRRSDEHVRVLRQKFVSNMKLRGYKAEEIAALLAEEGIINPITGEPFAVNTINKDLKIIEEEWRDEMMSSISGHRARVLAELQEVKRAAWKTKKLQIILTSIEKEINLLGLNELERMGVEIALANLLKGFPKKIADDLKEILAKKIADRKNVKKIPHNPNVIDISGAR